jgi:hypothetical protein
VQSTIAHGEDLVVRADERVAAYIQNLGRIVLQLHANLADVVPLADPSASGPSYDQWLTQTEAAAEQIAGIRPPASLSADIRLVPLD